ncbi:alcohol dehydrogenase catalytic domain-containing protein [Virgisporangium ochraceum]|uniref:Alcohol dehydrogenase n=1 Tax=Virgisporangium ochraceum TaxID=65505 RepID=A0A8J3ZWG3_9ACTN|nr:alcohol dehydrogenase [Virgisporangium ochraceum]
MVDVPEPVAGPGEVVVDVERAGVCGTDVEFFTGEMAYLHSGDAAYPMRIGHEWCGVVASVGPSVDPSWVGRRVTGDTMLGCSSCARCLSGRQHLCATRYEIGIRGGWPGALASSLLVPARALVPLPSTVDATVGALVEPGGNALRAFRAAGVSSGERLLVVGPGAIGLLVALVARSFGVDVHLLGVTRPSLEFARSLGFHASDTPSGSYDGVVDASTGAGVPALALSVVEPGRRVVYIGLSGEPSMIDSRELVFKDLTVTGILSASGGLAGMVDLYASGAVDPRPLVAATVGLEEVADVLAGLSSGPAPKVHVDPGR